MEINERFVQKTASWPSNYMGIKIGIAMAPVLALDIDCQAIDSITAKLSRRRRDTLAERPKLAPQWTLAISEKRALADEGFIKQHLGHPEENRSFLNGSYEKFELRLLHGTEECNSGSEFAKAAGSGR